MSSSSCGRYMQRREFPIHHDSSDADGRERSRSENLGKLFFLQRARLFLFVNPKRSTKKSDSIPFRFFFFLRTPRASALGNWVVLSATLAKDKELDGMMAC